MKQDTQSLVAQCQRIEKILNNNDQAIKRLDKKLRQLQIDYAVIEVKAEALKEGFKKFKIETTFYDHPLEIQLEEEIDWDDQLTSYDYEEGLRNS